MQVNKCSSEVVCYESTWSSKEHRNKRRRNRVERENRKVDEFSVVCADHDIELVVHSTQHWFFKHKRGTAEWWPSSGKLVFNQLYNKSKIITSTGGVWKLLKTRWLS